jgi:ubiquitin-protein ligase
MSVSLNSAVTMLQLQYASLRSSCPPGVIVVPSPESPFVWQGVIFVRSGPYAEGVFHFAINFSRAYPSVPPTLTFVTPVFHPFVGPAGELDTSGVFPEDTYNPFSHRVADLLHYLPAMLALSTAARDADDVRIRNPAAASLLATDPDAFQARVRDSVDSSRLHPNVSSAALRLPRKVGETDPTVPMQQLLEAAKDPETDWMSLFGSMFQARQ